MGDESESFELPGDPITELGIPSTRDLEQGRDKVRATLAVGLLVLLAAIVGVGFLLIFTAGSPQSPEDRTLESRMMFVQSLLGTVGGLFGAATGFYFGASRARSR